MGNSYKTNKVLVVILAGGSLIVTGAFLIGFGLVLAAMGVAEIAASGMREQLAPFAPFTGFHAVVIGGMIGIIGLLAVGIGFGIIVRERRGALNNWIKEVYRTRPFIRDWLNRF